MILILILDIGRKMILILILPFSRLILILDETDHNSEQTYQRVLMFVYIIIEKNSVRQVQKQRFIPNEKICGTTILGLNFDFQNQLILILILKSKSIDFDFDFEFGHLEKNDFDFDSRLS